MISGSAPTPIHVLEFFDSLGMLIIEGYALSENAVLMSVNVPDKYKFGTVGVPLDGNTLRIAEDGEILVKGSGVFEGYYSGGFDKQDMFDNDGFLKTGDLGHIDEKGFVVLTGRKKELIKTSVGHRVSPVEVESVYRSIPYIENIVVIGNNRKYITALLTINKKKVGEWCANNKVPFSTKDELSRLAQVRKLIKDSINQKSGELAGYKQVKKIAILVSSFSVETGEFTTTLKIRRNFIEQKFQEEIEKMYKD